MKLNTPADLARLVKNARVRQELTQQNVADAVGITRQSLARLERGNGATSFDTVLRIFDHLGIHLDATSDRRAAISTPGAATGAAQAAADALDRRITPFIDSSTFESINKYIAGTTPNIDVSQHPVALASLREASRRLTESLAIPGSVLVNLPRAVDASPPAIAGVQADTDPDDRGSVE